MVEITYNSELNKLGQVMLSADAFTYSGVTKYNLSAGNGTVTIGEESYDMNPGMQVFSEGRQIGVDEVINQDVLTFQGKGHSIMSITVDKGHGYLDLTGEDAFWEAGLRLARQQSARSHRTCFLRYRKEPIR